MTTDPRNGPGDRQAGVSNDTNRTLPRMVTPSEATDALRRDTAAPVIVDLDETLVLGPTTEAFLDSARPASMIAVALRILDGVRPWRVLPGGGANRDWCRVLTVLVIAPWSLRRWKRTAPQWVDANVNRELAPLLRNRQSPVVIATRSFAPIVAPVVTALGWDAGDVVACKLLRWRGQRNISKSALLERSHHAALTRSAMCVTDSEDDRDVLDLVATPLLVEWPGAGAIEPHLDAYVPFRYIHETKPPRRAFVRVAWITDDLYVVLLAYSAAAWWFPLQAVGVVLACLAMWIIYEAGYHENDLLGSVRETDPVLPDNFEEMKDSVTVGGPWIWALVLTVLAAPFLVVDSLSVPSGVRTAAIWFAVVAAVRAVFALFNRLPKPHRVIPHLLLQIGKYLGLAAVVPLAGMVGLALVVAQIIYRWIPYVVYRWTSYDQKSEPLVVTRLLTYLSIAVPGLVLVDHSLGQGVLFIVAFALLGRRVIGVRRHRS